MDLLNSGLDGIRFLEEELKVPYWKNIDEDGEENPSNWSRKFNLDNWGIFVAVEDNEYVGGAVLAYHTPEIHMLEGKNNITVLWDLRVKPEFRGVGIGSALFKHAVQWSKEKGCKRMKIETQNNNVEACIFYKKQGSKLGAINQYAYKDSQMKL